MSYFNIKKSINLTCLLFLNLFLLMTHLFQLFSLEMDEFIRLILAIKSEEQMMRHSTFIF